MFWNKKLKDKIEDQKIEISQLKFDISQLNRVHSENQNLLKENSELESFRSKVRTQTEADLFFISARIQKSLLEGKTKEELSPALVQQQFYISALSGMRPAHGHNGLSGLVNALGNLYPRF